MNPTDTNQMSAERPEVIITPAYSPKALTALVSIRVDGKEVHATPRDSRRIALELMDAAAQAETDTALIDFLIHKAKMGETEARVMLGEVRQHRAILIKSGAL